MSPEELEEALTCINCGKPAWEVRPGKDGCLGTVIFEPGYDATREEPGEPSYTYLICAECEKKKADAQASEIDRLRVFRGRVARILKQPVTDCDDLLILGLDARICQLKRQAARIQELEDTVDKLREIAVENRVYLNRYRVDYEVDDSMMPAMYEHARRELASEHPEAFGTEE